MMGPIKMRARRVPKPLGDTAMLLDTLALLFAVSGFGFWCQRIWFLLFQMVFATGRLDFDPQSKVLSRGNM
jgi:hypothetical protein